MLLASPAWADDSAPGDDDSAADDDDSAADDDDSAADAVPAGLLDALAVALGDAPPLVLPPPAEDLAVAAPKQNSGLNLDLSWTSSEAVPDKWAVIRAPSEDGPWELRVEDLTPDVLEYGDKLSDDPLNKGVEDAYYYRVLALPTGLRDKAAKPLESLGKRGDDATDEERAAYDEARAAALEQKLQILIDGSNSTPVVRGEPKAVWLNTSAGFLLMGLIILVVGGLMFWFTAQARAGKDIFIRRIPGIDAIEEGIGRATEMGKPVLYVPGIDELQDIQTIASMLILGEVSKKVAEYQSEIIVTCCIPIVREVADEVVKAGFYQAGYPDAYRSMNTRFISSEQFAFCAGTNGIILREKPATNIYLGRFFAESLILAETGFVNKSIQIAGTAEATQLPFFIAACDYTLIGEELFAVSAYLSGDPRLVSSLKASDWIKVFCVACLVIGTVLASFGSDLVITLFTASGH